MILLTDENVASQTLSFIPTGDLVTVTDLLLTDEETNVTNTYDIAQEITDLETVLFKGEYYVTLTRVWELTENRTYVFELKDTGTLLFRGKIFCTNQQPSQFSVNNGQYIVNTTLNEFITYE